MHPIAKASLIAINVAVIATAACLIGYVDSSPGLSDAARLVLVVFFACFAGVSALAAGFIAMIEGRRG